MNHSLSALVSKLKGQQNECHRQLQHIEKQSALRQSELQRLEKQITQALDIPLRINPDLEINRLNFITRQHMAQESLNLELQTHRQHEEQLKNKLQRINSELKILERYITREQQKITEQQRKTQENHLDEWVIQAPLSQLLND